MPSGCRSSRMPHKAAIGSRRPTPRSAIHPHEHSPRSERPFPRRAGRTGRRSGRTAGTDPPQPGPEVRRLSGQLGHAAGQAAAAGRRARWPPKSSAGSTWPTSASRRRSPGRASSICGSRTTGWSSGSRPRVSDPRLGVAAGRPAADLRDRLSRPRTWPSRCTSATSARR